MASLKTIVTSTLELAKQDVSADIIHHIMSRLKTKKEIAQHEMLRQFHGRWDIEGMCINCGSEAGDDIRHQPAVICKSCGDMACNTCGDDVKNHTCSACFIYWCVKCDTDFKKLHAGNHNEWCVTNKPWQ